MKLRARFRRFCHLIRVFPFHRGVTLYLSDGRVIICCDCGQEWE